MFAQIYRPATSSSRDSRPASSTSRYSPLRFLGNGRKAAEAKRALEEAFSGMDNSDKGEPPIGVPLKSPRTKTLKGGLKIKDT